MLAGWIQQHEAHRHNHREHAAWTMHPVNTLTRKSNEGSLKKQRSNLMPRKVASPQCTYADTGGTAPYLHHWWSQISRNYKRKPVIMMKNERYLEGCAAQEQRGGKRRFAPTGNIRLVQLQGSSAASTSCPSHTSKMSWHPGLPPPFAVCYGRLLGLHRPTHAHHCKTGDAVEASFSNVWKAPWEALCYINGSPSSFINKPILKRNSENGSFMVAYLNTGGRPGLSSKRARALLLECISKTTPLCRGENEVLLKKKYSPHPTLWTLINPDV